MSVHPIDKVFDTTAVNGTSPNAVVVNGSGDNSNSVRVTRTVDKFSNSRQETFANSFDEAEMTKRLKKSNKKWNRRFKILRCMLCCFGYKQSKDSVADAAGLIAEYFTYLDVPSSDLTAGFVLIHKYQAAQRKWILKNQQLGVEKFMSSVPITSESKFLDVSKAEDSHLVNDLIYYMNYSLAIFGWPLQLLENPFELFCLCPFLRISPCCGGGKTTTSGKVSVADKGSGVAQQTGKEAVKSDTEIVAQTTDKATVESDKKAKQATDPDGLKQQQQQKPPDAGVTDELSVGQEPLILGDNCCGCYFASAERRLTSHNYETIYASYRVNVHEVPFLVAADHSKQTIVVAVRGSMSLPDMVTDMNGRSEKLPIDDCPPDWLSHQGITRASIYVKTTLLQESILDRAFNCRPDLGSRDYTLILTGHSLGAGVAAILGILLRKQYPTLKAYLYSPPGGLLTLPAVEYTKQFAVSIMLGNDIVPRLGVVQLERLRYQVLLSLKSSQKSSLRVISKAVCPTCCLGGNKVDYDPDESLDVLYGKSGRTFEYKGNKVPFQVQQETLFVPGRMIQIVKDYGFKSKTRRFFNGPIYQALWNENTWYDRIMVSDGMFYDHLPHILMHAMKMLFSNTLPTRKDLKSPLKITNDLQVDAAPLNGIQQPPSTPSPPLGGSQLLKQITDCRDEEEDRFIVIDDNNNNRAIKKLETDDNNNDAVADIKFSLTEEHSTTNTTKTSNDQQSLQSELSKAQKTTNRISKSQVKEKKIDNYDQNGNDDTISNKNFDR